MKRLTYLFLFTFFVCFAFSVQAQKFGIGASAMYNLQSESIGFGLRGVIHPNNNWSYVPQISYYPSFNKVHEYTLGLGLEYKFIRRQKVFFYVLGHAGYNNWINYEESPMKDAKASNWNLEGGFGVSMYTCIRPFLEWRYNAKFSEAHIQLGVIYVFGCKRNSNPGSNGSIFSKGKHKSCPGYGNY